MTATVHNYHEEKMMVKFIKQVKEHLFNPQREKQITSENNTSYIPDTVKNATIREYSNV